MKRILFAVSLFVFAAVAAPAQAVQVYGTNYGGIDEIVGFNHTGGSASEIPGSGWNIGGGSGGLYSMAISRDGTRGVAGYGFSGHALIGFRIAPDGVVTAATPRYSGPAGTVTAASPVNNVVYGTEPDGTGLAAANQAADAGLTPLAGSPFAPAITIDDIAITPDGKFIYATGSNVVQRLAVAPDGSATYLGSVSIVGAERVQVTPNGRFLLALGGSGNDFLHSLAIGADGTLNQVGAALDVGDSSSGAPAIDKDSSLAVLPNSNLDKLVYVRIGADGALTYSGDMDFEDAQMAVLSADGDLYLQRTSSGSGLYFAARISGTSTFSAPVQLGPVNWYQDARLFMRPTAGGVAQFTATPQSKPLTYRLNASASTGAARYDWDLGSAGKASSASPTSDVTFAAAGTHQLTLNAVDSSGCGADLIFTGQSATCSGGVAARQTLTIDTPPWVTSLKVSPSKVTSKTKIKFKLTEAASVSFYAQRPIKGRIVGAKCKKQTKKLKTGKKCTLWTRASKTFRKSGKAGKTNSVKFTGKVGKSKLMKGSYRFYATATDKAKNKGPAVTAKFKIKK